MKNKKLNILIVTSWYPRGAHETNGSFVAEQALILKEKGHNVTVIHPYLLGKFFSNVLMKSNVKLTSINNITTLHIGVPPVFPGIRSLTYRHCLKMVLRNCEKYSINLSHFDLIHSHSVFMGGYIGLKLAKKFKLSFFHTEHASGLIFKTEQYNENDKKLIHEIFNATENLFFVSKFSLNNTKKKFNFKKNAIVLPNLVNKLFFEAKIEKIEFPFSYLIIGNLIPVKNHKLLIYAWQKLCVIFPNSILTISGEGHLERELKELSEQLKLTNINWIPRLIRSEVVKQICEHHVVISSSEVETFGLTIAEAQAMGKPVVVTDSGGVRDIVNSDSGIVTELTVDSFANGLITIQKNYENYIPINIRKTTSQKFSSNNIYEEIYKYYMNVYQI